jgi:hypothetical protein
MILPSIKWEITSKTIRSLLYISRAFYLSPKLSRTFFLLAIALSGTNAYAECDCTQQVGTCTGAIEFVRAYGSNKNYGAELIVHSNVKSCSKVEYFIDGTPYQTILINRNSEPESTFGTSPITEKNVQYSKFVVCKTKPAAKPAEQSTGDSLSGEWSGTREKELFWGAELITVNISHIDSNKYNIRYTFRGDTFPGVGTLNGRVLTASTAKGGV